MTRLIVGILSLSFLSSFAFAQTPTPQPPKPQAKEEVLRIGAEEVLLDLIVRDKKGRAIQDLKAGDLEVYEDGVKQQLTSFRLINRAAPAANTESAPAAGNKPAAPAAAATPDPARQINLVTMVFERLNNDSRRLAREAAMEFIKTEVGENVFVSVMTMDMRLRAIQPYTTNREKLKAAIEAATGLAASQFAEKSAQVRSELENAYQQKQALDAASANIGQGGPPAELASTAAAAKVAEMTLNTLRADDNAEMQTQGATAVYSLLSLITGQKQLTGRKVILFFSEGIQVPPNLLDPFRTAISAANRANVSFYTFDARGLNSMENLEAGRDMLQSAARSSQMQQTSRGGQAITFEQANVFDMAESSIRRNKQGTLAELAESTGGFLVANTNDFRKPMQRVFSELTNHYELSYSPPSREFDGKFRTITVKALRPDLVIQSRNGYFALPPTTLTGNTTLLPYELPLLGALNAMTLPREFPFRSQLLHFAPQSDGNVQQMLLLEVPLANLTFNTNDNKTLYRTHASILALVKNSEGRIVQKLSQDSPLEGPIKSVEALKKGNLLFNRTFSLPPGRYTVESIVQDRETRKLSARRAVLIVPAATQRLQMSSLTILKRIDATDPGNASEDHPFRFQNGKIVPNLGDAITSASTKELAVYMVFYPTSGLTDKIQATLEVLQDGQPIARGPIELSAPDKQGRIPYLARLPLENFKKEGTYEIRIVAQQGPQAVEEHAFFTIGQ